MLAASIGALAAIAIWLMARQFQFDTERSFYPTLVVVIAGYYILFAAMTGVGLLRETLIALGFTAGALTGVFHVRGLIALLLFVHGGDDIAHAYLIEQPVAPTWWPLFCGTLDAVLGVLIAGFAPPPYGWRPARPSTLP